MKKLFPLLLLGFCCLSPVFSQTAANANDDLQFWHETRLVFPLIKTENGGKTTEKFSVFFNGNLRFGKNISRLEDKRIGFGFDYRLNKYVSFTPAYIYIAQKSAAGTKQYESRLKFAVNLKKSWEKFSLDDRNLFEYRFRNNNSDSVRYRNRLRFIYPVKKNNKELFAPFAANEIFYDFKMGNFSRNEFSVGLGRKLNSNVKADFFYLLQINKSSSQKRLNVFGVNLTINVD